MHRIHPERPQVVDGSRFGECEKLTLIDNPRRGVDREVAVVQFVDNQVGGRAQRRSLVGSPSHRIGFCKVDDGTALAVHAYSLGKQARCFSPTRLESIIHALETAFHLSPPLIALCIEEKRNTLDWIQRIGSAIEPQRDGIARGSFQAEFHRGSTRHIVHLIENRWLSFHLSKHHEGRKAQ